MTCAHCGQPATLYRVPDNLTGEIREVYDCHPCRRRLMLTPRGPMWIKLSFYCAGHDCRHPVYRMVRHPRYGHMVPLWPNPRSVIAAYGVSGSTGLQHYCSTDCAPDVGARPHHGVQQGGACVCDAMGACTGYVDVRTRYPLPFTAQYHEWLEDWLLSELGLDREDYERLLALHTQDMTAGVEARPEDADGHGPPGPLD